MILSILMQGVFILLILLLSSVKGRKFELFCVWLSSGLRKHTQRFCESEFLGRGSDAEMTRNLFRLSVIRKCNIAFLFRPVRISVSTNLSSISIFDEK